MPFGFEEVDGVVALEAAWGLGGFPPPEFLFFCGLRGATAATLAVADCSALTAATVGLVSAGGSAA